MSTRGTAITPIDQVQDAIESVAAQLGCVVSPDAMNYLMEPASDFFTKNPSVIPMDDVRLRAQIRELFDTIALGRGSLAGQTLSKADFANVQQLACHYLWFC